MDTPLQIAIYVKPGSSKTSVGGTFDGLLVVSVTAPAIDGRANHAVESAVAAALGLPKRAVEVVAGASSRRKRLAISGASQEQIAGLLHT